MSTRNTILESIRDMIVALPGMHTDRVVIGGPAVKLFAMHQPVVSINWEHETGKRAEDKSHRTLQLMVSVVIKVDAGNASEPLLQLGTIYDTIHAALENFANTDVGSKVMNMTESTRGVVADGYEQNGDDYCYIASTWTLEYRRAKGSA